MSAALLPRLIDYWCDSITMQTGLICRLFGRRSTIKRSNRSPGSVWSISSSSDASPVRTSNDSPSPPRVRLKPNTPLYDQFLADLEDENESGDVSSLIKYIQQFYFFGDLCSLNPSGEQLEQLAPLSVKMEDFLKHISRHISRHYLTLLDSYFHVGFFI